MKRFLVYALTCATTAFSGVTKQTDEQLPQNGIDKIQIDTFKFLTDKNGSFLPEQLFQVPIGSKVKIYRTDGFCYEGKVLQIDKSSEMYKIVGTFDNCKDAGFGIAILSNGTCHGTILERDKNEKYMLEFSAAHKGWVFMKTVEKQPIQL